MSAIALLNFWLNVPIADEKKPARAGFDGGEISADEKLDGCAWLQVLYLRDVLYS